MIDKLIVGINELISKRIASYGITVNFKFDPNLEMEEQWRRLYVKPVKDESVNNNWDDYDNANRVGNTNRVLALYSRDPVRKSIVFGKNLPVIEMLTNMYNDQNQRTGIQINKVMMCDLPMRIKFGSDSTLLADQLELILLNEISERTLKMSLDYKISEEAELLEDVEYTVTFSDVQASYDSRLDLRTCEIDLVISGMVFIPFFKTRPILDTEMQVWVFDKSVEPTPENTSKGDLVIVLHPPADAYIK